MTAKKPSDHRGSDKLDGSKLKENPGPMEGRLITLSIKLKGPYYEVWLDRGNHPGHPTRLDALPHIKEATDFCEGLIEGLRPKSNEANFVIKYEPRKTAAGRYVERGLKKAESIEL